MKTLVSGTQSVSDGAAQLNTGVGTLIGTLNKMGTDLAETKASIGEISEDTANNAVLQYASLQNALIQGIVAETKGDTTAANDIYAQVVSQIGGTIGVDSISDVAGASAAIQKISSLISQTSLKVGEGVGMIGVIDTVSRKLTEPDTQEQITKLQQGAASLAEGAGKVAQGASQLSTGADAAAAGSAQVAQGAADLATGAGTLKTGAADLATGAGTLKKGASDLATGATKLKKGAGDLATGAGKVADGASTLHKGASDLSDGLNTLDGGIGQLKEKAGSLSTGADQLKSGTDQLATGASTLVSNNQKLNDGAGTLSDGTDAIIDGVGELSDGAHQLADGITEFSEDGIDEIINSYNGDIEPLVDRIQAVLDAGADYQTYTDIADGVNGSVKFIIKTDAVKAED